MSNILASTYPYSPSEIWLGCEFLGDVQAGQTRMGHVINAVQTLKGVNKLDLKILDHTVTFDDGTIVTAHRSFDQYSATVYVPPRGGLQEGQFYHVPGCVARYGFKEGKELYNEILLKPESFNGVDTSNKGTGVSFFSLKEAGLPAPGVSPDGSISRQYRVCKIEGADPDSGYTGSNLQLSPVHTPMQGPFSISFVVRLRQEIQIDYSFTFKTKELDNDFTVYNPIKTRFLFSQDGVSWTSPCPGSMAPLVGYKIPARFSDHWVNFTYPWADYNADFVAHEEQQIGYREILTPCSAEPLLASAYDPASPYWDKVTTGGLETLGGTFLENWAENTETQNAAPYASYCTFKVEGSHGKPVGTRVVGHTDDGSARYATVYAVAYDYNSDSSVKDTIFTLKDYQYKIFMNDAVPSLTFGAQPFPVCHPEGYVEGMNILGLSWFNGNRIMAGKVCDFQSEYTLPPIVSDPLEIDTWYHVCLTYDTTGYASLHITRYGERTINIASAKQSMSVFANQDELGVDLALSIGADNFAMAPNSTNQMDTWTSQWEFSSSMDIGMLRFYHRALTKAEAQLLTMEVLDGVFVADDQEVGPLQANGLTAVVV